MNLLNVISVHMWLTIHPEGTLISLEKKLEVPVISLYGSRETGGIARNGDVYHGVVCRVRTKNCLSANGVGEVQNQTFFF